MMTTMRIHEYLFLFLAGIFPITSLFSAPDLNPAPVLPAQEAGMQDRSLFLPLVFDAAPSVAPRSEPASVFGMETHLAFGLDDLPLPSVHWLRNNAVLWSDVEPVEGARNWEALALYEPEWRLAYSQGKEVILVVRSTPEWAHSRPDKYCGAIRRDKLESFARFMHDLVVRYSQPPYSIRHWELWNEPDVDPSLVPGDYPIGCWGDDRDVYYGGGYYAEMLKVVYPAIKSADPGAQVLAGGLLLSCDPRIPDGCPYYDATRPPRFLEGILRNGGRDYFDGVSFHSYDMYLGEPGKYHLPEWNSSWDTTGPLVVAKARFLREVMANYGVSGKDLYNTESALMIPGKVCDSECELAKAYYVVQMKVVSAAEGLKASIWYSSQNPWRHTGLFSAEGGALPAYQALNVAWNWLGAATYVQELSLQTGVKAFEFQHNGQRIAVLWSADGEEHRLRMDGALEQVVDLFGEQLAVNGDELTVSMAPTYVVWKP